jgi:hypothetical protein
MKDAHPAKDGDTRGLRRPDPSSRLRNLTLTGTTPDLSTQAEVVVDDPNAETALRGPGSRC